ncbi:conserved oligomeric Golgi complex subunit 2 [Drosophila grimshawi]|uniref:Conserved oligomeric Golgi complex subunit 2 n=1 Tax=Drosophila grimshawi TaxID=7222 RepID=B4JU40_DROGR|nr:conserved oligomeric Golgi complex subunit 2 [Drosophila grimshawi]EDV91010.1 GH16862 [Drosophila grimshawi]
MHEPARKPSVAGGSSTAEKLCFDKNEFMKENFSVDEFLHKNRNAPSLEQLRDNLGLYLKGLRAAMIDLINEDYADFVNLSANLVGLDQSIETIQRPLEQFRGEIESIHSLIEEQVLELRDQLQEKRLLREYHSSFNSKNRVYEIIGKLQELISNKLSSEQEQSTQAVDLERAALDLIFLRFHEKNCVALLDNDDKAKIQKLEEQVHQKLRRFFNDALQQARNAQASEQLERCLRIYITLDACEQAERAFREDVVAPYMSSIIGEQQLQNSPQGLAGIYSKILNFISLHMTDLLRLTLYSDKLSGFNFVVNSFWADVEMRLELHMNSIYAPGNLEVFYVKYKCTRDFLGKIEELLTSSGEQAVAFYRQHKQTKSFEARWNLPVYFQICFQEIAGAFEAQLEPLLKDDTLNANPELNNYQLAPFNAAKQALTRCWAEGVYLPEVFPKFYKLNVQIVLRLSRWITDAIGASKSSSTSFTKSYTRNQLLIALHADTRKLEAYLPELQQLIVKAAPKTKNLVLFNNVLSKSIAHLGDTLDMHLGSIQETLKQLLITECGTENVRQVNDLPRLYRKTNREVPTRCSGYVEQMLRPIKSFTAQHETQLGTLVVQQILADVCSNITKAYFNVVSDVLTSVQKTEESLRRLRNLKSGAATHTPSSGVSDDDKIRLQLRVDVAAWTQELSKLNFQSTQIDKLLELTNMVEESIKQKEGVALAS